MKNAIRLILLLVSVSILSFNVKNTDDAAVNLNSNDSGKSLMALYGEYVFNKEKCSKCHLLFVDTSSKLISLDGIGNRYNYRWHYRHLEDPRSVNFASKMPEFGYLFEQEIDYAKLNEIFQANKHLGNDFIHAKAMFEHEMDSIKSDLDMSGIEDKRNSDVFPLLSFLISIPRSPMKCYLDSLKVIENKKRFERLKQLQSLDSAGMIRLAESKDADVLKRGERLYFNNCTPCHGQLAQGVIGPNLTDEYWLHGGTTQDLLNSVIEGIPDKGMRSWKWDLTPKDMASIVAYVNSLNGSNPPNAKEPQGAKR